ncbi:plasmid pRiA4b ORF-3 family protein [Nocardia sp. NPDC046763]|uniref:plasmid pRiA4b ORF-3 family protein n=1 Tax=Nocardia sp. NPDC046763 TaxID=3155256 RepID=UPI003400AF83
MELAETQPPVWRVIEVASDLFLDQIHDVLQIVFDWEDYHLHQFGSGTAYYDRRTEYYLCPFQAEEGEAGIPEEQVRLDEVLVDAGDRLFYLYDFGDDWLHVLQLEEVVPRDPGAPLAWCADGRRPGAPEDCGGVPGYELLTEATDSGNPNHAGALAELREMYGDDIDFAELTPIPFDLDHINTTLEDIGVADDILRGAGPENGLDAALPEAVRDVVMLIRGMPAPARKTMHDLVDRAQLDSPVAVDPAIAQAAVRPYTCLLEHLGRDGVTLTSAGYLPPAIVESVFTDLSMAANWIGKGNREDLTPPVHLLRESAQSLGLVRKHRGKLLPTPKARALHNDPVGMWWHLAERVAAQIGKYGDEPALVYLVTVAAGVTEGVDQIVLGQLPAIGWTHPGDSAPADVRVYGRVVSQVVDVFERMDLLRRDRKIRGKRFDPAAREFARSVLIGRP